MRYSGTDYGLRAGDYAATVTEFGARLRTLTWRGRDLVVPFGAEELPPFSRGAVLAPWPNRIAGGRYRFGGTDYQLPITEVATGAASHGLAAWEAWRPHAWTGDEVALDFRIWPRPGYPFLVDLRIWYALAEDGLTITLAASNDGDRVAPYGCGIHPYLMAGDGPVDDWTLWLPAATMLEVDPVTKSPVRGVGVEEAEGRPDFRAGARIGGRRIDNAFGGLDRAPDGICGARVLRGEGQGVELTWDGSCAWVQVFTSDFADPAASRTGLAIEPTTCPPNAFATGTDLISLEPGQTARTTWRIGAI